MTAQLCGVCPTVGGVMEQRKEPVTAKQPISGPCWVLWATQAFPRTTKGCLSPSLCHLLSTRNLFSSATIHFEELGTHSCP